MANKKSTIKIDMSGNWKLYATTLPDRSEAVGVVTVDGCSTGALVRLLSGQYVQLNAGCMRNLDGRKVASAIGKAGRPAEMDGGKRVNLYLDSESLSIAYKLGDGNYSAGVRKALKQSSTV